MRFKEFKPVAESITNALSTVSKIGQMADMLDDPFGYLLGKSASDSKDSDTGDKKSSNDQNASNLVGSTVSANWREVSNYLKTKMDDIHRLGILTNIQAESNFRPGVLGDNKTSGGLFQHHGSRFKNMVSAVGSDWATDWQGQIDFALSEPEGREYLNTKFLSAMDASQWFTRNFERPANASQQASARVGLLKNFV